MSTLPTDSCWVVLIETDSYAGNFERDLCAFLTGTVGECGVGSGLVSEDIKDVFKDFIYGVSDEHGCYRPCSIWLNEDNKYNSVAIFFYKRPTYELIDLMKDRLLRFNEHFASKDIQFLNFQLFYRKITVEMIEQET